MQLSRILESLWLKVGRIHRSHALWLGWGGMTSEQDLDRGTADSGNPDGLDQFLVGPGCWG